MKLSHVIFVILFLFTHISSASTVKISPQETIQDENSVVFDNNNFDGVSYKIDDILYISERILFPATINGRKVMLEMSIDRPNDDKKHPILILTCGRHGPFPTKKKPQCM